MASETYSHAIVKENKTCCDHSGVFASGAITVDLHRCERSTARQDGKSHTAEQLKGYVGAFNTSMLQSIANNNSDWYMITKLGAAMWLLPAAQNSMNDGAVFSQLPEK